MHNSDLIEDLRHMAAMAEEMDAYLMSDVLFWRMDSGPRLTLGGYLMRQHRVLALADELNPEGLALLNTAVSNYNNALHEKIVRYETKANNEIEARLRQWGEFLGDLERDGVVSRGVYANGVETRIMLEHLLASLRNQPYHLNDRYVEQLVNLDSRLRRHWQPGDFVLDNIWQEAYPEDEFWYLYGMPGKSS